MPNRAGPTASTRGCITPAGLPKTAAANAFERLLVLFFPTVTLVTMVTAFQKGNVFQTFPTKAEEAILLNIWFQEPLTRGEGIRIFFRT